MKGFGESIGLYFFSFFSFFGTVQAEQFCSQSQERQMINFNRRQLLQGAATFVFLTGTPTMASVRQTASAKLPLLNEKSETSTERQRALEKLVKLRHSPWVQPKKDDTTRLTAKLEADLKVLWEEIVDPYSPPILSKYLHMPVKIDETLFIKICDQLQLLPFAGSTAALKEDLLVLAPSKLKLVVVY